MINQQLDVLIIFPWNILYIDRVFNFNYYSKSKFLANHKQITFQSGSNNNIILPLIITITLGTYYTILYVTKIIVRLDKELTYNLNAISYLFIKKVRIKNNSLKS